MEELGDVEIDWCLFSLGIANLPEGEVTPDHPTGSGGEALQLLAQAQRLGGNQAVARLYSAMGTTAHVRNENLGGEGVLERVWTEAGLEERDRELAATDPTLWNAVVSQHRAAVASCEAFGVPTLILDGGHGPGIFGPIITEVPPDRESRELLRDVVRMARRGYFFELKRDRESHRPQTGG